jgi:hypothetical protein
LIWNNVLKTLSVYLSQDRQRVLTRGEALPDRVEELLDFLRSSAYSYRSQGRLPSRSHLFTVYPYTVQLNARHPAARHEGVHVPNSCARSIGLCAQI